MMRSLTEPLQPTRAAQPNGQPGTDALRPARLSAKR